MNTEKTDTVENSNIVPTPYDDAFRTMMNDCVRLLIPVLNEVFGKDYTGKEKIVLHPNEHFINQQDGKEQKRVTDSAFSIISENGEEDKYVFECQSNADDTLIIRIFEYITQVALDSGEIINHKLIVTIPNAAVLFLRSNKKTPNAMTIVINTPGGSVNFDVPIIKVNSYSLEEIFEKNLYFLLPFYIFNLEKNFPKYENNPAELKNLKKEYTDFMARLEQAVTEGKIFTHDKRTILEMSKKVLEYEGRNIFYEGLEQGRSEGIRLGRSEGRLEGRTEALNAAIDFMRSNGISIDKVNDFKKSILNN